MSDVLSRVPLGQFLFIIFINDMPSLESRITKLFADVNKITQVIWN